MISSELTTEIEKDIFSSQTSNALPLSHRDYGEQGPLQNLYMTHVLHTTRISYISSVMFRE